MAAFLFLAALVAAPMAVVAPRSVQLSEPLLRVADVVTSPAALPVLRRSLVIARLPRTASRITLSRAALASLVRRALPGVALADTEVAGNVTFMLPQQVLHAPRTAVPLAAKPPIVPGQTLQLASRVGPVGIERPVTALQVSRGKRVFVRDTDGTVFSVRVATEGGVR